MAHVVKELEIALDRQVTCEQRIDFAELNSNQPCFSGRTEVPPLIYLHKEEPEMILSNGNHFYAVEAEKGRPLPKFGEWDADDPASTEGFTVIFNKARDEKKTGGKQESSTDAASNDVNDPAPPKGRFTVLFNKATDKMKKVVSRSSQ
ncbi:hypothetical protein L6452_32052 [Arctium lappa]|uniref:Uncharacterized protein n=1 Tax=Arctium lappa TaxID=4217 RepID=A0ACB8Z3K6_ARCLA|nr:hypothetical protein L6452_32052 [Arctium lappa]